MSFERMGGSIQHLIAIPAPDLHSCGLDMALCFVHAPERCAAPAARALPFLFVVYNRAPLTGRWGDKVIPPGADRIPPRVSGINEGQARVFRHGHERATYYAGVGRGKLPRTSLGVGAEI